MKHCRIMALILVICLAVLLACGLVCCDFSNEEEVFEGYSNVNNVEYDMNFISIDRSKSLFASSFKPLMPSYDFFANSRYKSMRIEGTLGDALLETKYNYYMSINNPQKKYLSEQSIYEAYTLSVATPTIWDEPEFYGLESSDLTGYAHESVWFDYDYFYNKLEGIEDREGNAKGFASLAASYNFETEQNEMPAYYIFYPETSRVSYVTFNAYSDKIKNDYKNHQYPRTKEYIEDTSGEKKVVTENFEIDGVSVELNIIEEKKICTFYVEYPSIIFGEEPEGIEWFLSYEGGCYIKTLCTANFKIGDVNYTITYPLMNRLTTYISNDFGTKEASDYLKLSSVAKKSMSHFIGALVG